MSRSTRKNRSSRKRVQRRRRSTRRYRKGGECARSWFGTMQESNEMASISSDFFKKHGIYQLHKNEWDEVTKESKKKELSDLYNKYNECIDLSKQSQMKTYIDAL